MMLTITGRKQIINYTGKMFANTSRKYLKIIYWHPRTVKFTAKNMGCQWKEFTTTHLKRLFIWGPKTRSNEVRIQELHPYNLFSRRKICKAGNWVIDKVCILLCRQEINFPSPNFPWALLRCRSSRWIDYYLKFINPIASQWAQILWGSKRRETQFQQRKKDTSTWQ